MKIRTWKELKKFKKDILKSNINEANKSFKKETSQVRNAVLLRIGRIIDLFQQLEYMIKGYITILLNFEDIEIGKIITNSVSFNNLIDMFCLLLLNKYPRKKLEIQKIYNGLKKIQENRNSITHSFYTESKLLRFKKDELISEKHLIRRIKMKKNNLFIGYNSEITDETSYDKIINYIIEVENELHKFWIKLRLK